MRLKTRTSLVPAALLAAALLPAQTTPLLKIDAAKPGPAVALKYGLMTEEINYSYDGGLYAELIRNRSFKESDKEPAHWVLVQEGGAAANMALDPTQPLNSAIGTSLKLTITQAGAGNQRAGIANGGFWGIPVRPGTRYRVSFYAKASPDFKGPVTLELIGDETAEVHASAPIPAITPAWKKYEGVLTTSATAPISAKNHLVLTAASKGTIWFSMVSLFPPTFNNRPNGNRRDIMQLLADFKPAFLRFPGGNYLEGNTIETRFDWKKTIGDISQRPAHVNDAWRYWSSDGMGLLEFLEWCEDLKMTPVLGLYAGYSLRQQRIKPGADLQPYVQDALDEIAYVTASASTTWGARRAADGHPAPFPLEYVEIGNEDNFDREPGSYEGRFSQFFDAIRSEYPKLKIIGSARTSGRTPDVIDEHYYRRSEDEMAAHSHDYDARPRTGPKIFVGEWATRVGAPTPNMSAALGDAAWMTNMERNSDLVIMSAYAPLFVNVNPGAMQWPTDLIGYDALNSYGSPAYYAQKMFNIYKGDVILPATAESIPTRVWQPPTPRPPANSVPGTPPPAPPPAQQVPTIFWSVTRDTSTGVVFLKIVNRASTAQPLRIELNGLSNIEPRGQAITLSSATPNDTNSITDPTKIVPVTSTIEGLGASFTRTFVPYSLTILQIKAK